MSAIVVSYDSAATLGAALAALADAGGRVELIVADNASHDASVEVARAAGARVIEAGRNRGFAAGCNAGAAAASGRFLLFANPDTVVPAATALRVAEFLAAHPDIAIAGLPHLDAAGRLVSKARRFPTLGGLVREVFGLAPGGLAAPGAPVVETDWVQGSALAVPREIYLAIGGMDEALFLYFEDVELCRRVRACGRRVVELRDPTLAIAHDETRFRKYHSRLKVYAWHRSCARTLEGQGAPPFLVRTVLAVRAASRAFFWTGARLTGRIDPRAYRERIGGYADTLRFCLGWRPPPLPSERS